MVIASDGIWEFLENQEIVDVVGKYYSEGKEASSAAEYLIEESRRRWMKEEEVIDDITIVIAYFN